MHKPTLLLVTLGLLIAAGCRTAPRQPIDPMTSINTLHPEPEGFIESHVGSEDYPIPTYAERLAGVKICLDPGHGGDAHKPGYKRGPTGVREAEMNFRIACYLRALLEHVGAEVRLTREGDVDLSLAERAQVANDWGADIFISMHHNAIDNKPHVNRTSVWYHGDVDYRPSNLDLARYLLHGLQDSLALEQVTGAPLKSDNLMYDSGFGVLRGCEVTAALCESSFFTNPEEEQRLRDPEYNFLEAYGLFVGLAKYAAAGLPKARLLEVASDSATFELDDGLRSRGSWGHERQMIITSTVAAYVDGDPVLFDFSDDGERYLLTVELPSEPASGEHTVEVQFQNMFKNSVLNPHFIVQTP